MSEFAAIQGTQTSLRVPPRVLLVGRTVVDAAALVRQLGGEGYFVILEVELDQAVSRLRAARFEFVLLDIDAAAAGSQKFVETLRGDGQLEALPVLVISRSDDISAIEGCLDCGAD